jgi:hypothetical protein
MFLRCTRQTTASSFHTLCSRLWTSILIPQSTYSALSCMRSIPSYNFPYFRQFLSPNFLGSMHKSNTLSRNPQHVSHRMLHRCYPAFAIYICFGALFGRRLTTGDECHLNRVPSASFHGNEPCIGQFCVPLVCSATPGILHWPRQVVQLVPFTNQVHQPSDMVPKTVFGCSLFVPWFTSECTSNRTDVNLVPRRPWTVPQNYRTVRRPTFQCS